MRRVGRILISAGIACLLAALALFLYNQYDGWRARTAATEDLAVLRDQMSQVSAGEKDLGDSEWLGTLYVPLFGLELPVRADYDYDALYRTPCRYTGSVEDDDLVICAHNYPWHFGQLRNISLGESVRLEDMRGEVHEYAVVDVEIVQPTDIDAMIDSEADLTLFTCTYGGQARVAVRCQRVA